VEQYLIRKEAQIEKASDHPANAGTKSKVGKTGSGTRAVDELIHRQSDRAGQPDRTPTGHHPESI